MERQGSLMFGEFEIARERFELLHAGRLVPIEPKALEVLIYLASNSGRLVSKDELWSRLWRGRCVGDAAIAKQVREARRALGDCRRNPIWIKTVYGRGTVFIGSVTPAAPDEPASQEPRSGARRSEAAASPVVQSSAARVNTFDLMLRGKQLLRVGTEETSRGAFELFEQAAKRDPGSAAALAGVAISSAHRRLYHAADRHQLTVGRQALSDARELRPDRSETRHAEGLFAWIRGERDTAATIFEDLLACDVDQPECLIDFCRLCYLLEDPDRAIRILTNHAWRRKTDYRVPLYTALGYRICRESAHTAEFLEKGVCAVRRHLEVFPQDARAWSMGGAALSHLGKRAQALEWTDTALNLALSDGLGMFNAACVFTKCGDADRALATLRALGALQFPFRSWIEFDRDLDPLRGDSRFAEILDSWPESD